VGTPFSTGPTSTEAAHRPQVFVSRPLPQPTAAPATAAAPPAPSPQARPVPTFSNRQRFCSFSTVSVFPPYRPILPTKRFKTCPSNGMFDRGCSIGMVVIERRGRWLQTPKSERKREHNVTWGRQKPRTSVKWATGHDFGRVHQVGEWE
jgi:hypothetical protein